jgi:hypothetical protein
MFSLNRGEIPERIAYSSSYYPKRFRMVAPNINEPVTASDPDFLYAAPDQAACAAFVKESRIKCAKATNYTENPGEALAV